MTTATQRYFHVIPTEPVQAGVGHLQQVQGRQVQQARPTWQPMPTPVASRYGYSVPQQDNIYDTQPRRRRRASNPWAIAATAVGGVGAVFAIVAAAAPFALQIVAIAWWAALTALPFAVAALGLGLGALVYARRRAMPQRSSVVAVWLSIAIAAIAVLGVVGALLVSTSAV